MVKRIKHKTVCTEKYIPFPRIPPISLRALGHQQQKLTAEKEFME